MILSQPILLFLALGVLVFGVLSLKAKKTNSDKKVLVDPKIHAKLYDMMEKLDAVMRKNSIVYFIGFGTLLGAVREKSIILWDDDADVLLESSELEKLKTIDLAKLGLVLDYRDHIWRVNSINAEYPYIDLFEVEYDPKVELLVFSEQANRARWSDQKFGLKLTDVFPLKNYKLGKLVLRGPRNYDSILTRGYGDYMTPVYWKAHGG